MTTRTTATAVAGFRPSFSIVIAAVYAALPANLVPSIIGGLVAELAVPLGIAGASATAMTLANAAAVLVARPVVSRGHRILLARIGVSVLIAAFLAGATIMTAPAVIASLIVGGIGSGLVVAAATASISRTVDPDRTTTVVVIANRIVVAAAFLILPLLGGDIRSLMLSMAVVGVIAWLGANWLPGAPAAEPFVAGESAVSLAAETRAIRASAWLLAVTFALWTITEEGTYALLQVLVTTNVPTIDAGGVSMLFALSIAAGLLGSLCAPLFLRLLGRSAGIAVLLALSIVVKLGLVLVTDQTLYLVCGILWGFAFGAVIPLVFGLAAIMVGNGSASVLVNGVYVIGVALGPLVSTVLFEALGQDGFGYAFAAIGAASAVTVVWACVRAGRLLTEMRRTREEAGIAS